VQEAPAIADQKVAAARLATRGTESHLGVVTKKRRRPKHERATMKIEDKIDQT
jgi:hypothetical protein